MSKETEERAYLLANPDGQAEYRREARIRMYEAQEGGAFGHAEGVEGQEGPLPDWTEQEAGLLRESIAILCYPRLIGLEIDTIMGSLDGVRAQIRYSLSIISDYSDEAQALWRAMAIKVGLAPRAPCNEPPTLQPPAIDEATGYAVFREGHSWPWFATGYPPGPEGWLPVACAWTGCDENATHLVRRPSLVLERGLRLNYCRKHAQAAYTEDMDTDEYDHAKPYVLLATEEPGHVIWYTELEANPDSPGWGIVLTRLAWLKHTNPNPWALRDGDGVPIIKD